MPLANLHELEARIRAHWLKWPEAPYASAAYEAIIYLTGFNIRSYMFSEFELYVKEPRIGDFRLIQLGEAAFALRNEPLLQELSRRLHERPIRSVFFEFSAAARCAWMGFDLVQSPGLPEKGSDYDFGLVGPRQVGPIYLVDSAIPYPKVNVEVTEFQVGEAQPQRLLSRLKAKSKQLPRDAPAVLFCYYPFGWQENQSSWQQALDQAAVLYFKNSRRINWIIYISEYVGPLPGTVNGDFVQHTFALRNPSAHHEAHRLDAAMVNRTDARLHRGRMPTLEPLKAWVDTLLARS